LENRFLKTGQSLPSVTLENIPNEPLAKLFLKVSPGFTWGYSNSTPIGVVPGFTWGESKRLLGLFF